MATTPDGTQYMARHPERIEECWIQPDMFPNLHSESYVQNSTQFLDEIILSACAMADEIAGRHFLGQTVDQVFNDTILYQGRYNEFTLKEYPVKEVENVWLQILGNFYSVQQNYLQLNQELGLVKILPTFIITAIVPYPYYINVSSTNLWIRYKGGFKVDYSTSTPVNEVPHDIRYATSLLVNWLWAGNNLQSGVSEFKTQTYSQKMSGSKDDPVYQRAVELLSKYKPTDLYVG